MELKKKEEIKKHKEEDYEKIMKLIKEQPGIEALFEVMGQYDQLKTSMEYYLGIIQPEIVSNPTNNTN